MKKDTKDQPNLSDTKEGGTIQIDGMLIQVREKVDE
jgi:hypothetical protein